MSDLSSGTDPTDMTSSRQSAAAAEVLAREGGAVAPGRPEQLWLIPWENPLAGVLGAGFFRALPPAPGVYLMRDAGGRVIYVGKSVNLRQRVSSYKYVRPGRSSRKVVRLVGVVRSVEVERCADEAAALLRENALLRRYRPPFNRVNTHPESNVFVRVDPAPGGVDIAFANRLDEVAARGGDGRVYGSFPGWSTRRGLLALFRLGWNYLDRPDSILQLPPPLNRPQPPRRHRLDFAAAPLPAKERARLVRKVGDFFCGRSDALAGRLCGRSGERTARVSDRLLRALLEEDRAALLHFFQRGTLRVRQLQAARHRGQKHPVLQPELDDLLTVSGLGG